MGIFLKFINQTRKPKGFLGKMMVNGMNKGGHVKLANWGMKQCFAQVARVLKSGGVFMIVNESDGTDEEGLKYEMMIDGMKCYTAEEIENALRNDGFSKVKSVHHKSKPWITVLAKK